MAPKRNRIARDASILIVPGPLPDNCPGTPNDDDKMNVSWSCLNFPDDAARKLLGINGLKGFIFTVPDQDSDNSGSVLVYAHYTVRHIYPGYSRAEELICGFRS